MSKKVNSNDSNHKIDKIEKQQQEQSKLKPPPVPLKKEEASIVDLLHKKKTISNDLYNSLLQREVELSDAVSPNVLDWAKGQIQGKNKEQSREEVEQPKNDQSIVRSAEIPLSPPPMFSKTSKESDALKAARKSALDEIDENIKQENIFQKSAAESTSLEEAKNAALEHIDETIKSIEKESVFQELSDKSLDQNNEVEVGKAQQEQAEHQQSTQDKQESKDIPGKNEVKQERSTLIKLVINLLVKVKEALFSSNNEVKNNNDISIDSNSKTDNKLEKIEKSQEQRQENNKSVSHKPRKSFVEAVSSKKSKQKSFVKALKESREKNKSQGIQH